jgi:XTP/dITP diphosphohydrolase
VTDDRPGAALLRLVAVIDTLRVSCPWDARQTHESLAPHLLEECYEALDALEGGDPAALRDELGDVLLQVMFHARIAAERTDGTGYTIDDVAEGIVAKLVRRHPHVFADVTVSGPEEVKRNWDAIKVAERAEAGNASASVLDTVPFGQPALALAAQLQRRAERAGAPANLADLTAANAAEHASVPADQTGAPAELASPAASGAAEAGEAARDEVREAGGAAGTGKPAQDQAVSALGAELFALVARAREVGLDPELELRAAARAYRDRVRAWERAHR